MVAFTPALAHAKPGCHSQACVQRVAVKQAASMHGGTPAANQRLGRVMARAHGWVRGSWRCLRTLWHFESGWNHRAVNPLSGAGGIPQALPFSKIGPRRAEPRAQLRWGLSYIASRYSGPCRALAAWRSRSPHWY